MIELPLEQERAFSSPASPAQAWALLSAIPDSAAHFPDMEELLPVPPDGFTWRLRKTGVGPLSLQAQWTSRYRYDQAAGTIDWTPIEGSGGNMLVSGGWRITPEGAGCRVAFKNHALFQVPAPRLMKSMVEGFVRRENERLIDDYLANLARSLAGGQGRLR